MNSCILCSGDLLRHIQNQQLYWYCSQCRQTMAHSLVKKKKLVDKPSQHYRLIREKRPLAKQLLCQYQNQTQQPQVLRIVNESDARWERGILPGEKVRFYAAPEAILAIHSGQPVTAMLEDHIPCQRLCLKVVRKRPLKPQPTKRNYSEHLVPTKPLIKQTLP